MSIFEWPFYTGFTVHVVLNLAANIKNMYCTVKSVLSKRSRDNPKLLAN